MGKNKEIQKSLNLLAKTSVFIFIIILFSKIMTYLYRIIVARLFGPEIYGVYSLAIVILGWFSAFAALGLTDGLVRFASFYRGKRDFNKIKYLFHISSSISLISGVIAGFIMFYLSDFFAITLFHNQELAIFLKFFSILAPFMILSNIYVALLRSFEKVVLNSFLVNIVQNFIKLSLLVTFIFLGLNYNSIIFSYFLGTIILFFIIYIISRKTLPFVFTKNNLNKKTKEDLKNQLVNYSWPIMFSSIFISVFYWIDSLTIGLFNTPFEVGIYNAAIPIIALSGIFQELFMQLFFPLINKEYSKNNLEAIKEQSKQVSKWIFMLTLPFFLLLILFPGEIISILFGQEYVLAKTSLMILAIGGMLSFLSPTLNNLLLMAKKSKTLLVNIIVASIINLILNIVLVQKYGINGAALATSIVSFGLFLTLFIQSIYYLKIFPLRRKMFNIFVSAFIPFSIILLIKPNIDLEILSLFILGIFFSLSYLLLIFLTKSLDESDWTIINLFKNKLFKH